MKKRGIINSELSHLIALMGHKDKLTICDAGLPIAKNTERIDLALTRGVPDLLTVIKAVLDDLFVEKAILAEEIKNNSPELYRQFRELLQKDIEIELVTHNLFKEISLTSKGIVRTGETTPFANIILVSGVDF